MEFLSLTNADGSVKTFFNGRISATQLVLFFVILVIGLILWHKAKKIVRFFVLVAMIASTYFNVHLFSPAMVLDAATVFANNPIVKTQVTAIVNQSDNIRMFEDDIEIKIEDKWVSLKDIKSIIPKQDGSMSVSLEGRELLITDKTIISLLKLFTSK